LDNIGAISFEARMNEKERCLSVLLVEDDPADIFLIKEMLQGTEEELKVTVADNGQKAMDILNRSIGGEKHIDLVILDLHLPKVNGFEVLSYMRSMHGLQGIPVMAMAGPLNRNDEIRAMDMGASGFIIKPSSHSEFQEIVDRLKGLLARSRK
jgi:DNA-binding response OmpR family regulator